MGAKVQHGVGLKVFAKVAVKRRERMRGGQALFKQQAHRVAFVAEGRLHAHQHVAELFAQHHDGLTIAELLARRGAPLRFNLRQPALAANVVIGRDQGVHIAVGPVLCSITDEHAVAQRIHISRHVNRVALCLHGSERVEHRLEHRQVSRAADVAGVGREVEHHHRHFALSAFHAAQRDQLAGASGQHDGPLGASLHVLCVVGGLESAGVMAAGAGDAGGARAAAKHRGAGAAIQLRNGHHDGAFHRQQTAR